MMQRSKQNNLTVFLNHRRTMLSRISRKIFSIRSATMLKNFLLLSLCVLLYGIFFSGTAHATEDSRLYLNFPFASAQALSRGGVAAPGDASSLNVNPALLSVSQKNYEIYSQYGFAGHINSLNLGVKDAVSSPVAAAFQIQQLFGNSSKKRQRRFSLGLSYLLNEIPLSLGMSVNFDQYNLVEITDGGDDSRFSANFGAVYELHIKEQPVFAGFSIRGINDPIMPTIYNLGLSTPFYDGIYFLNVDSSVDAKQSWREQAGIQVHANKYLDIKGSVGYNVSSHTPYYGAGIFFNAPVLHVYYSVAKIDLGDKTFWQTAGISINLAM